MLATKIAQQLLLQVKMDNDHLELQQRLVNISSEQLQNEIYSQNHRLAFWINLYNAFFQIKMKEHPAMFKNKIKLFFGKHFTIAGHKMSLDDIEHNMLRQSTFKWSLGYIKNPFPSQFEKALQVFELDNRIHFALNCGAVSCPPIRFYTPENVQEELELATNNFLHQECNFDAAKNTVEVTSIFSWFRGDFGGIKGIKEFLANRDFIPNTSPKLSFKKYNWEQQFEHYG